MKSNHSNGVRRTQGVADDANVHRLLRELHEKKRWLDTVIDGLEAAAGSPDHQLIARASTMFEHLNGSRPKVDLGPRQQQILAALASQVGRRRAKRVDRPEAKAA